MQLGLFYALNWLASWLPLGPGWWDVVGFVIAALLGGFIPLLFWGKLELSAEWEVNGIVHEEAKVTIDMRGRESKEFTLRVALKARYRSFLAQSHLKTKAKAGEKFVISFHPTESLRVKSQVPTGGSQVIEGEVILPLAGDGEEGIQSTMHFGVKVLGSGSEDHIRVGIAPMLKAGWFAQRMLICQSGVQLIKIVS